MFGGAGLGVLALLASLASAYVLYEVADAAQKNLGKETRTSSEKIAELNNQTAQLTADNLALQTVMLPRKIGLVGVNESPPAGKYFAGIERFAGTRIAIQVISGDKEAANLGNEIGVLLRLKGMRPELISDRISNIPDSNIVDGVRVAYPVGAPASPQNPHPDWAVWHDAAEAIADALTAAGLGIGSIPVARFGFQNTQQAAGFTPYFLPPLDGVYVQIGSRPISATIQWIKAGRPDITGVPANKAIQKP